MNLGENRMKCGFHDQLGSLAISVSRIPKPFLIEFITRSSPWRPVTPLSVGPPPLRPRRSCSPGAPSGDRRGFGTVPSLLREARACSATPIAATRPSADLLSPVLVCWSWKHSTSCTALSLYSPEFVEVAFSEVGYRCLAAPGAW